MNAMDLADDVQGRQLRSKMNKQNGRNVVISNTVNFGIDNPFGDYSLTLQTIKREKHEAWKVR